MKYLAIITQAKAIALKAGGAVCGAVAFGVALWALRWLGLVLDGAIAFFVGQLVAGVVEKAAHPVVATPGATRNYP